MTFEPLSDHFLHTLSSNQHHFPNHDSFPHTPDSPVPPVTPTPTNPSLPASLLLSDIPTTPLTWLWPARIPLGHLTLLDAAPGCDPSLLALTLAASISSGTALPDGTPTTRGTVLLFAPYDSAASTIKPRLQAADGDPARVLLFRSNTPTFSLPRDLPQLADAIRLIDARLLILDPASAIPGLTRSLPALAKLARQTNCAILLVRSLRVPIANPLHSPAPPSPLLDVVRSRILLAPAPDNENHTLLLTTSHPLCPPSAILIYNTCFSPEGIPTLHFLGAQDHTQLARLCTGPLYSPHRQAILHFLQTSPTPQTIPAILDATSYDPEAGRKMLIRMKLAGELYSPARGLYTIPNHPSLSAPTNVTPSVPPVPIVPTLPDPNPQSPHIPVTALSIVSPIPTIPTPKSSQPAVGADLSYTPPIYRPVPPAPTTLNLLPPYPSPIPYF